VRAGGWVAMHSFLNVNACVCDLTACAQLLLSGAVDMLPMYWGTGQCVVGISQHPRRRAVHLHSHHRHVKRRMRSHAPPTLFHDKYMHAHMRLYAHEYTHAIEHAITLHTRREAMGVREHACPQPP
jgi:hypothetical protein